MAEDRGSTTSTRGLGRMHKVRCSSIIIKKYAKEMSKSCSKWRETLFLIVQCKKALRKYINYDKWRYHPKGAYNLENHVAHLVRSIAWRLNESGTQPILIAKRSFPYLENDSH